MPRLSYGVSSGSFLLTFLLSWHKQGRQQPAFSFWRPVDLREVFQRYFDFAQQLRAALKVIAITTSKDDVEFDAVPARQKLTCFLNQHRHVLFFRAMRQP